ncbi:hypothetical protein [Treponema sp.]|uniref:hypothetical protein n=1 Tax=Treponema sp. TaxID=166 RepID=UPI0025F7E845|nr:hypothetical protein [Treponema sp.]MBQ7537640.1 hypothetical protein [Treponema sp.]MBR4323298.1 hypothetical protein [Treponema sp.]
MAKKSEVRLFWLVLNIAVGALLAVGGIWALQGGGDFGCKAIKSIFNGDIAKILAIVFGVIELLSGIFIILQLFIGDRMGTFGSILKLIVIIVWAVAIVLADFLGNGGLLNGGMNHFLSWLYDFAMHMIVLCALLVTRD